MPTYTFINTTTNESEDKFMTVKERDEYLSQNPHIKQALSTPTLGDSVRLGIHKTPDSFNDVLKHVKNSHKHSTIQTRN